MLYHLSLLGIEVLYTNATDYPNAPILLYVQDEYGQLQKSYGAEDTLESRFQGHLSPP